MCEKLCAFRLRAPASVANVNRNLSYKNMRLYVEILIGNRKKYETKIHATH